MARLVVRRVDRCPNGSADSTEIDMDLLTSLGAAQESDGGGEVDPEVRAVFPADREEGCLAQGQPLLAVTSSCRSVTSAADEPCAQSTPSRERR